MRQTATAFLSLEVSYIIDMILPFLGITEIFVVGRWSQLRHYDPDEDNDPSCRKSHPLGVVYAKSLINHLIINGLIRTCTSVFATTVDYQVSHFYIAQPTKARFGLHTDVF